MEIKQNGLSPQSTLFAVASKLPDLGPKAFHPFEDFLKDEKGISMEAI